ncbi:hypothetical protein ACFLQZ_02395 [Acidobacteriota bacterium]
MSFNKGKKTCRFILLGMSFFLLSSILNAQKNRIEFIGTLFFPSERSVQDIYGSGLQYKLDLGRRIGKELEIHLEYGYFTQKGRLTLTQERTRMWLNPLGVSVRYLFLQKKINLYAGAGVSYNSFREKNPIGEAEQSKVGFMLKVGGFSRFKGFKKVLRAFIIGVQINYNYCEMRPVEIKFNSGGIDFGLSFGVEF